MPSLSIFAHQGALLRLPGYEFHCIRATIRTSKNFEFWVCKRFLVKACCNRRGYGSLGSGVFFGRSEIRPVLIDGNNRVLGMRLPIGLSLEELPISDNVSQGSNERVNLGVDSSLVDVNRDNLDDKSESEGEKTGRVDVRALSKKLQHGNRDNLDKSESEGEKTGRVDVRALSKKLLHVKSVEEVEEVLKDEARVPLQVFSSIIRTFGREKKLDPAMAVVAWLKEKHNKNKEFDGPNLFIYNSLLGAVKQSGEFDKHEVVMNDISDAGFFPNVVTFNTLMGIYLDDNRLEEALKLLEDMKEKGIPLSPASFSTALLAYRKMEDGNGALRLFVGMREMYTNGELRNCDDDDWEAEFVKIKDFVSRVCYQVMRRWLVKEGNHATSVLKLLIEMDKGGVPLSNTEYERLIWACTREEHYTVVKELYNRIREQRGSNISLSVCNHVIWLMGKARKWWAALEVYEDLLEIGPKPNSMSYELVVAHFNVLLSAARKRGIWRWGLTLLEKMESKGLKPRTREWNAVLVACSKASETAAAIEIFKKMVEQGEKPTEDSYGALLSALEKGKMYDEAIRVWERMLKIGIKPKLYSYTIMASVYVGLGNFSSVESIIKEMIETGNNPTVITFNAILSVCLRNGLGSEAFEWFNRMKEMNIDPNEITYETLILALAKDGKPRLAYDMYVRVVNEGLSLSYKAYDAVIQSSRDFEVGIDVRGLGPRPVEHKRNVVARNNVCETRNIGEEKEIHGEDSR